MNKFSPITSRLIVLSIILFSFTASLANAEKTSVEPADSWVYNSLNLIYHYHPPEHFVNQRPLWRGDIIAYLDRNETSPHPVSTWERQRILSEYATLPELSGDTQRNSTAWLKLSPYSMNRFEDHDKPLFRLGFVGEGVYRYGDNLFLQMRGRFGNRTYLDSFAKVRKWGEDGGGYFDHGLLGLKYKSLRFTFGRTFRTYGPYDKDRLLVSANSPAFDQVSLEFRHDWFRFHFWTAQLDHFTDPEDSLWINRFYSSHRLTLKPHRRLEIGISESILYGRKGGSFDFQYMNPFLFFYGEQFNTRNDENIYFGLDLTWFAHPGLILFGELLLDDFQIDFVTEPHQIGFNLGISELGLLLSDRLQLVMDYTHIRNTVYGQNKFYNVYAHHGVVIGSSLGTDADRLRATAIAHLNPCLRISLAGEYSRKGEGRYDDPQEHGVEKGEKFPSGRVETTQTAFLKLELNRQSVLQAELTAGYRDIRNWKNYNIDRDTYFINFNLRYSFRFGIIL